LKFCNINSQKENYPLSKTSAPTLDTRIYPSTNIIADTGATGHYLEEKEIINLLDLRPMQIPLQVEQADGSIIKSSHSGTLDLPELPEEARNHTSSQTSKGH
jgi:hypothetical protein